MGDWFLEFSKGRSGSVSLLREYNSHAICRGVCLKVELLLEIRLPEDWSSAYDGAYFIERCLFLFSPVEGDGFSCEG